MIEPLLLQNGTEKEFHLCTLLCYYTVPHSNMTLLDKYQLLMSIAEIFLMCIVVNNQSL